MNDILDIELILKRDKYPFIYNIGIIISIIILIFLYIIFTYNYQSYYKSLGKVTNNEIEILVYIDDIKYLINNNTIFLDGQRYNYLVDRLGGELLVDDNYQNYQYVYLKVDNLCMINNYVYEVKIPKENKKIIDYLKEL